MQIPQQNALINNSKFIRVLIFGIVCTLIAFSLRDIIGVFNGHQCIDDKICNWNYPFLCIQNGYAFCCGGQYGLASCGGYQMSCIGFGSHNQFGDCEPPMTAIWLFYFLGAVSLITLVFMAREHRNEQYRIYAQQNSRAIQMEEMHRPDWQNRTQPTDYQRF